MAAVVGNRERDPESFRIVLDASLHHHAAGGECRHRSAPSPFVILAGFVEKVDVFLQREQGEGKRRRGTHDHEHHHREALPPGPVLTSSPAPFHVA